MGSVHLRRDHGDDAPRCDDPSRVEVVADAAAGVDRVKDRLVTIADGGGASDVLAPDVDEVGVVGERRTEAGAVGSVRCV